MNLYFNGLDKAGLEWSGGLRRKWTRIYANWECGVAEAMGKRFAKRTHLGSAGIAGFVQVCALRVRFENQDAPQMDADIRELGMRVAEAMGKRFVCAELCVPNAIRKPR